MKLYTYSIVIALFVLNLIDANAFQLTVSNRTVCQNETLLQLNKCIQAPSDLSGYDLTWSVTTAPSGVDKSKLLYGSANDMHLEFGTPGHPEYAGDYKLHLLVRNTTSNSADSADLTVTVLASPGIEYTTPAPICSNWLPIDLRDHFKVNGSSIGSGLSYQFTLIAINGDRSDPRVATYSLANGYMFSPAKPAGGYQYRFSTTVNGCTKADSIEIVVNPVPKITVKSPIQVCSGSVLDLGTQVRTINPEGGIYSWAGVGVTGSQFSATGKDSAPLEPKGIIKAIYTLASTGCSDTAYSQAIVQNPDPIAIINDKPTYQFEGTPLQLKWTTKFGSKSYLMWYKLNAANGNFTFNGNKLFYTAGINDLVAHGADLKTCTVISGGVCPPSCDSFHIQYYALGTNGYQLPEGAYVPTVVNRGSGASAGFKPVLPECKSYHLQVLNAAGQVLFETSNQNEVWNADVPEAVYFCKLEALTLSGTPVSYGGKVLVSR